MSFKGFLEKFTFRSRKDFDDDQDSRKTEKYWKILRREVAVDRFMFDSAEFDHKVEAAFMIMKRSSEVREEALKWFESDLKVEREKVWRKLMREKNVDLSSAMPYLIKINQADAAWRAMDDMSREYIYEWQRRVNFTILEMFILRLKAFRSRKDFDGDQDNRKTEKYWKILRREVAVDRFMFDSAEFDHKVEAAFMIMKRSSEVREEALKWFETGLKVERERVWRKLMRDKNTDLSSAMPYLIKINQADAPWRAMDDLSREYVYEWQRRVNFTILEMFILRHKALPLSKRIKNTLFRKKK